MTNVCLPTPLLSAMAVASVYGLISPKALAAADLWVSTCGSDSNSGSQSAPFRTIRRTANVVHPGDNVHVIPGTYWEKVVSSRSGTASARIRYVSTKRWGAKITTSSKLSNTSWTAYTQSASWYNTGNYVDIDGFEIYATMGSGGTLAYGIYNDSSNTRLINNKVHDISASPCTSWGGAGIVAEGWSSSQNVEIYNNIVYNVGDYAGSCVFAHGIYHTSTGAIINNLTYRISGGGIHLWHMPHHNRIINNTVFNTKAWGIVFGADSAETSTPADHAIIANNIVYDTTGVGIASTGLVGTHNIWTNNLVYKNGINWSLNSGNMDVNAVSAPPQFANYQRDGGGDYRLTATSPAIGKASKQYAPAIDLDGLPRDAQPDIGAYERQ